MSELTLRASSSSGCGAAIDPPSCRVDEAPLEVAHPPPRQDGPDQDQHAHPDDDQPHAQRHGYDEEHEVEDAEREAQEQVGQSPIGPALEQWVKKPSMSGRPVLGSQGVLATIGVW